MLQCGRTLFPTLIPEMAVKRFNTFSRRPVVAAIAIVWQLSIVVSADETTDAAKRNAAEIIDQSGVSAGFFVHLAPSDTALTAALRANGATQVHGLVREADKLRSARQAIQKSSDYGDIAIDLLSGNELPYVDNLVNLLVCEDLGDVSKEELLRVLVPNGVAMLKVDGAWEKLVKPRPSNIDDWSHYLHDATGNSVAHDDVVAPPRHLQWVGSPRWSRHHDRMASMSALVSEDGKMFYIMDEGSRISIQLPPKWKLIARDAFNGSVLWKRDIEEWQTHLWPLKSGPTQLSRRLVAADDRVLVTLGYNAPLTSLDAASGEIIHTYEDSGATEEVITTNGLVFVVVRKTKAELQDYAPANGRVGDQAAVRDLFWDEEPRVIMAFDLDSGERLWAKRTKVSPLTLSASDSQIYFHDGEKLVSLNQKTGDIVWESDPVTRRQSFTFNFGPRLVINDGVVLYAGGDGNMQSLDAKTGVQLWDAQFPNSGYQSPQDLMVVGGLVWLAPLTNGKDSGVYTGRDPKTGEIKKEFAPDVDTYWFHHRCYIAKGTDNFLIPSRTGTEFVDPNSEHWDINHWVRGGCLYGVMPCNGLTYTPPHDCACYPEAKLFGFNALAPTAPTRPIPRKVAEAGRLDRGPAYGEPLADSAATNLPGDWPTYRHDATRSGTATLPVNPKLKQKWTATLGGRLTPPVIADATVYVARIDAHTLHALDETSGETKWTFTAGARIDSPPTVHRGRVVFGATDGWIYCLTTDGDLVWRYRAAPLDRRTMAYEQLESLWPVHGSVLIHNDMVYGVAGRSVFLDGGLRLLRLDLASGEKLSETIMDEKNPETGNNMQEKVQVLQMPVGLPDILSCDGTHIFMKSQKFDLDGNRLEIGPNSGEFAAQASKQRGDDAHIFAPMGFLDETWFHRSYWVMGQSFAGGHGGYYQAGRFAPSGRIMVNGNGYVFGYGRKPEYLRWTTTLEHQLFAAEPNPPEIPKNFGKAAAGVGPIGSYAQFPKSPSLDPSGKPITVEAWITTTRPQGVIIASGGPSEGFALAIQDGQPTLHIRSGGELSTIKANRRVVGGWHHVAGVLQEDKTMQLYVDGELTASGTASGLIVKEPAQALTIGLDSQTSVGDYQPPLAFTGIIDEVRLYFLAATDQQIADRFKDGSEISSAAVLAVSFDDGSARDHSVTRNNGTLEGGRLVDGKFGKAIQFSAKVANNGQATPKPNGPKQGNGKQAGGKKQVAKKNASNRDEKPGDSLVKPKWTQDVPIYVRSMVLAGSTLFIAGPPDIIDEEETFEKLTERDPEVQKLLAKQDAALEGADGRLLSVNIDTGLVENEIELGTTPAWDAMAGADGMLFLSTLDGTVVCFGE